MWRSKILDPIHYGWHAVDDGTTLYPTTLKAGVSAAPLTNILHLHLCMLHQPSVFYLETWVRGSSNVMFNVLQLQCWIRLL